MFHIVDPLLLPQEIERLMHLSGTIRFVDGRQSNVDFSKKKNLQPDHNDPGYKEAANIIHQALMRNEYVKDYCMPKALAVPMMTKYSPGMEYGEHVDMALLPYNPPLRPDVSCTVFLSDPGTYDGGELCVRLADKEVTVKEKPGVAVLYPSTTYHRVMPVTRGERVVSITFIESMVRDPAQREILVELTEFTHANAAKIGMDAQVQLEYIRQNLTRMWFDN